MEYKPFLMLYLAPLLASFPTTPSLKIDASSKLFGGLLKYIR